MRCYKDWENRKVRTIVVFLVMNLFTCIWNHVTNVLIANDPQCRSGHRHHGGHRWRGNGHHLRSGQQDFCARVGREKTEYSHHS